MDKRRKRSRRHHVSTGAQNQGKQGFLRIDTVYQGSTTKGDGLYHINVVDEVTQYEFNASVSYINEFYMEPLLIKLIDLFPFKIMNFHSDNGSEYINVMVNELLTKLFIKQTKSRLRRSTDNGLIETKNAQVIRKFIPRGFISKDKSEIMNVFFFDTFHEFVNFHRVSMYPTTMVDKNGKKKVSYPECKTPYQKFISLPDYEQYLKPGITAESLSTIFYKENHIQFLKGFSKKHEGLLAKIY